MRYKGYYYDREISMYYLRSRYYFPGITAKFLNADLPEYAKQQKDDHAGTNLFAYCCNDPVNNVDYTGELSTKAFLNMIKLGMSAYNKFLCVRLYCWGFLHRTKNRYYDFSKNWGSKIVSLLEKSTLVSFIVHEMIYDARRKGKNNYTSSNYWDFYRYHKNLSDIDLILSLGTGAYLSIKVSKTSKVKTNRRKNQYLYKVTCTLKNETFDFTYWNKSNAHSNNILIKLINNIGFYTQRVGAFVKFKFRFSVTYDYWYSG